MAETHDRATLIQGAWDAFHQRDWAEAERRWAMLRTHFPQALIGYSAAVTTLREAGRLHDADAMADVMLQRFPDEPAAHIEHAWLLTAAEEPAKALEKWRMVQTRFPDQWQTYLGTARLAAFSGEPAEAILESGLALFPGQLTLLSEYATIAVRRADWPEAARRWSMLRLQAPQDRSGLVDGAHALREMGQFTEAAALLEQAIAIYPSDPAPVIEKAALALSLRDWTTAEDVCSRLRERFPNEIAGYSGGILSLREARQFNDAEAVASISIDRFPDDFGLRLDCAWLAQIAENWPEAVSRWAWIRNARPDLPIGYREGIRASHGAGQHEAALALTTEAAQRFGDTAEWPLAVAPALVPPIDQQEATETADSTVGDMERFVAILRQPRRARRIVILGNCQAQAMAQLYRRFVGARTGETIEHVPSYEDVTPAGRAALEQADLIVEQLFDLKPKAETVDIASSAKRLYFPMVTGAFLWPFAGQAHPRNVATSWQSAGAYGGESTDSFLNRAILAGTPAEEAVEAYMCLDVTKRVNLDRLFELVLDRQKSRDMASGHDIASVIEEFYKTEPIFLSPYHPNRRIALALATRLFEQMGADQADIDRLHAGTHGTPFPRTELPIHPGVARHFGLTYAPETRRYLYANEGRFTAREFALRYMRYQWNEPLEFGIHLAYAGKLEDARVNLIEGLEQSVDSAMGHSILAHVLSQLGDDDGGLAHAAISRELEPTSARHHGILGDMLRHRGRLDEAEQELLTAIFLDPGHTHHYIVLAHLYRSQADHTAARELIDRALAIDPYLPNLLGELINCHEAVGELEQAIAVAQRALSLDPTNRGLYERLSGLLRRTGNDSAADVVMREARSPASHEKEQDQAVTEVASTNRVSPLRDARIAQFLCAIGDFRGAEARLRTAIGTDPNAYLPHILLGEILVRRGDNGAALEETKAALLIAPDSMHAEALLDRISRLLQEQDLVPV